MSSAPERCLQCRHAHRAHGLTLARPSLRPQVGRNGWVYWPCRVQGCTCLGSSHWGRVVPWRFAVLVDV